MAKTDFERVSCGNHSHGITKENLRGSTVTTSYYLGNRLVAQREGTTLRNGIDGSSFGSIRYHPYAVGSCGGQFSRKLPPCILPADFVRRFT